MSSKSYSRNQIELEARLAHLGLSDEMLEQEYPDALAPKTKGARKNPYFHFIGLMLDPKNLYWTCKTLLNVDLLPFQVAILQQLWTHKFPLLCASRGFGKSYALSVYAMLRAVLFPGSKVIIVGAAFRQSKVLFEYMQNIWNNAPILQDICNPKGNDMTQGPKMNTDQCHMRLGKSKVTCIPLGNGDKIRGLRATITIVDEMASVDVDVFERVVAGFGAVSANPVESVKEAAAKAYYKRKFKNLPTQFDSKSETQGNQLIISGTAYYDFSHFAKYWKRYKAIIMSGGDPRELALAFGSDEPPDKIDYREYCVIRIPVELLPEGFMDAGQVARSKATVDSGIFSMEFQSIFCKDSTGFFKRTLIESCIARDSAPIKLMSGDVSFRATRQGISNRRYVYGIDPAALSDNFAIVIIELHEDHRRVVNVWTTNKKNHRERLKQGHTKVTDFYGYCARRIRELMCIFPCERIGIDAQGGGFGVIEALHDVDKMYPGEQRIWEIIEDDKEKDSDSEAGLHIIEAVQFANSKWVHEANHGLKKDFEDKALLLPHFDSASLEEAAQRDKLSNATFDTLEDVMVNIEELKNELTTIINTQTTNGTDRWDTPEIKLPGMKKGRLRKDRYSALLIANAVARKMVRMIGVPLIDNGVGLAARDAAFRKRHPGAMETGPEWYMEKTRGGAIYGGGVISRESDY